MAITAISRAEHHRIIKRISGEYQDEPELLELAQKLHTVYESYERSLTQIRDIIEQYDALKDDLRKREHRAKRQSTRLVTLISAFLFLFNLTSAMAQRDTSLNDGPYVFYKNETVLVKSVTEGIPATQSCKLKDIQKKKIAVTFAGHPDWGFRLQLKKKLEVMPSEYPMPAKMFVISDTEGEYQALRKLLIANHIMNSNSEWTYGRGHLVIAGDLFDRGSQVTEQLWLIYKLETMAKNAGGHLHLLLGNHDIMNLSGDLRYVAQKYSWSANLMGMNYMQLYSEDSELGRWLRTKNSIEKIGDKLFVHAGVSNEILKLNLSLQQLNDTARPCYATPKSQLPASVQTIFGKDGLFWYRGYFMTPRASQATIEQTLAQYQVSQIIVGHTILERNIAMYYGGKVIGIDLDYHLGHSGGLSYEKGKRQIAHSGGKKTELVYKPENDNIKDEDIL